MNLFSVFRKKQKPDVETAKAASPPPHARTRVASLNQWLPRWIRTDYTMKNSELLFSAISRISNALSAMPIQLYRGATPVKNNYLNDLLRSEPNPSMTSCTFIKTLEACRGTAGNCYALKVMDPDGTIQRLEILDPTRVKPVMETSSGELWYRVRPEGDTEYYIHNFYMLHVPFISTNGYIGINPVSVLFDTLSYSEKIQQFSTDQLDKGVNAAIVVTAPATLGEAQREETINALLEAYRKTGGNILLLESGLSATRLNLSPVDANLFEVEKITRSKVAMVYNIPPHLLGDYSDTSFSSQEQQMLEFLMLTMLPIVTAYEQEFNRKLLTKEQRKRGYAFRFNMDSILRADAATRAEVNQKAIRGAWKKPNEVRGEHGDEPVKEGDHLLVSRDLTTLAYLVAHPEKNTSQSQKGEKEYGEAV